MMRFRSASIALVVLAASLVIADENLDEFNAIEKIELLGGSVMRDDKLPGRPVNGIQLIRSKKFNDEDMRLLGAFPGLTRLSLNGQITDVGLIELGGHKNLTELRVNNGLVTNDGLKTICKLSNLTALDISGTQITDAGLIELKKLKKLTSAWSLALVYVHPLMALWFLNLELKRQRSAC